MSNQTPTNTPRWSVTFQEETIEVKPSTELIADVFEREDNKKMLVYIFGGTTDPNVKEFKSLLKEMDYEVNMESLDKNIYDAEKRKNLLENIQNNAADKDGLIMLFVMASLTKSNMEEIWSAFRSTECIALKDKPKIFIFQIAPRVAKDAIRRISVAYTFEFDSPSEADILIVYEKVAGGSTFIENLTNNINLYGAKEDIASLVTHTENTAGIGDPNKKKDNCNERHILISTMTKKFYFLPAERRGHHYEITKYHQEIDDTLQDIKRMAETPLSTAHTPTGQNKSFFSSITRRMSFKSTNVSPKANKNRDKQNTKDTPRAEQTSSKTKLNEAAELKTKSKPICNDRVDHEPGTSQQSSGSSTPKSAGHKKQTAASTLKIKTKPASNMGNSKESIKSNITPTRKSPTVKKPWMP